MLSKLSEIPTASYYTLMRLPGMGSSATLARFDNTGGPSSPEYSAEGKDLLE